MGLFGFLKRKKDDRQSSSLTISQKTKTIDMDERLKQWEQELYNSDTVNKAQKNNPIKSFISTVQIWGNKLIITSLCVGIPLGCLWVVNLPYPAIRRPIYNKFPLLLLPSQIYIDNNYKQSVRFVRQGIQLVDNATSLDDILLGEESLKKAQKYLDGIPFMPLEELNLRGGMGFYGSFSHFDMQRLRGEVGELEAKVFQEKKAHELVEEALVAIDKAKIEYQQSTSEIEKQAAIKAWRMGLNQLTEVPASTWARKNVEVKYQNILDEFKTEVGEIYVDQQLGTFISTAQEFSSQAIALAENPPHNTAKWEEVEKLWQMAIDELKLVPQNDLQAYGASKQLIAEYSLNLAQVKLKKNAETESVTAFNHAQEKIQNLLRNTPTQPENLNINQTIVDLQNIINELNKVEDGTTVYEQSKELKVFADNKIKELQ